MEPIILKNVDLYMNTDNRFEKVDRGDVVLDIDHKVIHWCHAAELSANGGFTCTPGFDMLLKQKINAYPIKDPVKMIAQHEVNLHFEFEGKYQWKGKESSILEFRNHKYDEPLIDFFNYCGTLNRQVMDGMDGFNALKDDLLTLCKTSPQVDLNSLPDFPTMDIARSLILLNDPVYLAYFKDPSGLDFEPLGIDGKSKRDALSRNDYIELIIGILRELIDEGRLTGIVDREKQKYYDRDFAVKEQRVVNVQVDFNALVSQLGNKGVVLNSIQCTQCGASLTLPRSGCKFYCSSCGSLIQVADLFEKFKSILD